MQENTTTASTHLNVVAKSVVVAPYRPPKMHTHPFETATTDSEVDCFVPVLLICSSQTSTFKFVHGHSPGLSQISTPERRSRNSVGLIVEYTRLGACRN